MERKTAGRRESSQIKFGHNQPVKVTVQNSYFPHIHLARSRYFPLSEGIRFHRNIPKKEKQKNIPQSSTCIDLRSNRPVLSFDPDCVYSTLTCLSVCIAIYLYGSCRIRITTEKEEFHPFIHSRTVCTSEPLSRTLIPPFSRTHQTARISQSVHSLAVPRGPFACTFHE